jgi:hypothetical protein
MFAHVGAIAIADFLHAPLVLVLVGDVQNQSRDLIGSRPPR